MSARSSEAPSGSYSGARRSMDEEARKPLLEVAPYHRSEEDAREYVGQFAEQLGVPSFRTKLAAGKSITIPTSGRPMIVNPRTEVSQARLTGVPPNMKGLIDNSDRLMPAPITIGGSMRGIGKFTSTIRRYTATLDGDGILESPVGALADDVLFYRSQAVEASVGHSSPAIGLERAEPTSRRASRSWTRFWGMRPFPLGRLIRPKRHPMISILSKAQSHSGIAPTPGVGFVIIHRRRFDKPNSRQI